VGSVKNAYTGLKTGLSDITPAIYIYIYIYAVTSPLGLFFPLLFFSSSLFYLLSFSPLFIFIFYLLSFYSVLLSPHTTRRSSALRVPLNRSRAQCRAHPGLHGPDSCTRGAESRTHSADLRTRGADSRTRGPDLRTRGPDSRTHGADSRTRGADLRTHGAESCLYGAAYGLTDSHGRTRR
jgi:hypothetical protein